jgi:triosephosphate isomerase
MAKILIANWKASPKTLAEAAKLARAIDAPNVVVAPPFPFLEEVRKTVRRGMLGAQDVFWTDGPYTGEISAGQLKKLGVKYVIVGHSERRRHLGESDLIINRKLKAAMAAGLKVVLCVGEGPEYHCNAKAAKSFVRGQLRKDLVGIRNRNLGIRNLIVAYEPVWAIGTGLADSPKHAAKMAKSIKSFINARVLYGGSVTSKNAARFLSLPEISGALVGGASLNAGEFKKIIKGVTMLQSKPKPQNQ